MNPNITYNTAELIIQASQKRSKKDKADYLRSNKTDAMLDIFRGTFDDRIKFLVPNGWDIPYTASEGHNHPTSLSKMHRQFNYICNTKTGNSLPQVQRERKYIEILEGIHPADAQLVVDMVNKKAPKGITKAVVREAFPGLLPE